MKNVALITGASRGIGRELALLHAARGGDLVIVARSEDALRQLKKTIQKRHERKVRVLVKDLTEEQAPQEVFDWCAAEDITVTILINNAGFGGRGYFHERDWATDRNMIQLNIVALTALTRLFLPGMLARKRGRILNVSSIASLMPGPLQAVYFATKAYVTSFTNAIAEETRGTGVTATALLPGATETDFAKVADLEDSEMFAEAASAKQVAREGYEAMRDGELEVLSGLSFRQRLMMKTIPFAPKKQLLKQVREMQEKEK